MNSKQRFILLSEKKWNKVLFDNLKLLFKDSEWLLIDDKKDFINSIIKEFNPNKIFIPHWSYYIPSDIYEKYECVVFHMTDLPFGRGGSPLQNLIARGIYETKITALKVSSGIDAGDIYCKESFCLHGSAREIFARANDVILSMIKKIIDENIVPIPQIGEPVYFKRRKPEDGNLNNANTLTKVYDYVRMLDADGYPRAFIEINGIYYEFSDAIIEENGNIKCNVIISKK